LASLVNIAVFSEPSEAVVARSCLDAHGFVAILPEWHHASVAWHHVNALQGLRLWTVAPMAAEARELLRSSSPALPLPLPPEAAPGWFRPDIASTELLAATAAFLFTGLPFPYWKRRQRGD